jgi:hypothetical protein
MNGSHKISWRALEHIKTDKSADWFWVVGIIAVGIAILAIYFSNILFALVILIGTFAIFLQSNIPPAMRDFELNRQGVISGKTLYTYTSLESFYVVDEDGWDRDRILLKSKKLLMPLIVIPLGENVAVDEVSTYLLNFLPEEAMEEPTLQLILNRLGF